MTPVGVSTSNNPFHVLDPVTEEEPADVEAETSTHTEAEPVRKRSRAEACDVPPSKPRAEECDIPPAARETRDVHVDANQSEGISSETAQLCSDIAAAANLNWSTDETNLMDNHMGNNSEAQRNSASVEGVMLNSQSDTLDPIVSTNESVDNSMEPLGSRVALDSDGNTLVRETNSSGSMSTLLGSFEDGHESDSVSVDEESNNSESDARAETERFPTAATLLDGDGCGTVPSSTAQKSRKNENRAAKVTARRLTRSMGTGHVDSTTPIE